MEGPKVTEEIRRSDGHPTRSEISEYRPVMSLDLVSRRAIPQVHVIENATDGRYRWAWSHVSLDWGGEREEGVDDIGRREASLMTSAMSGSAISDRCTVT